MLTAYKGSTEALLMQESLWGVLGEEASLPLLQGVLAADADGRVLTEAGKTTASRAAILRQLGRQASRIRFIESPLVAHAPGVKWHLSLASDPGAYPILPDAPKKSDPHCHSPPPRAYNPTNHKTRRDSDEREERTRAIYRDRYLPCC
jgi:hypothetical protein